MTIELLFKVKDPNGRYKDYEIVSGDRGVLGRIYEQMTEYSLRLDYPVNKHELKKISDFMTTLEK